MEAPGCVGVEGERELVVPAELEPGLAQGVIALLGSRVLFGQVGGVGRDLVRDHTRFHVVAVGQSEMFLWGDVAQHGGAGLGDHGGADR